MGGRPGLRWGGLLAATLLATGCAWLERSSVTTGTTAAVAGGADSFEPSLSQSGRYVAFTSRATDLVAGDTNAAADVFVRDNVAHTTERVSLTDADTQSETGGGEPSISDDGRYVAFTSGSRLGAGDTDDAADVFVRDRVLGTTTFASVAEPGRSFFLPVARPAISGDGSTVAFVPFEHATLGGGIQVPQGPYVRHLATGVTTRMVDPPLGGIEVPRDFDLADDGSRIALVSAVASAGGVRSRAWVADTTTRAEIASLGTQLYDQVTNPPPFPVAISGDGRTWASADTPVGTAGPSRFRVGGDGTRSAWAAEYEGPWTDELWLADDGARLGTRSAAFGYVALLGPTTGGGFELVSANADGKAVVLVNTVGFSGDAAWLAFDSGQTHVAPGDTRGVRQVYTRSVAKGSPPPS